MNRTFLTYFDVNYAARGLAMIESLLHWCPGSRIVVLCLDDQTEAILLAQRDDRIATLSCATLADHEGRLNGLRASRTPWEFYATQKPVLIDWALDRAPSDGIVSFIDADTYFYSDPGPLFAEVGSASVAVSPHRFNDTTQHLAIYGQFNAGFGIWRNEAIGRQCVRHWIEQCLDWCYCRVEADGRFMNQGYLNDWPSRYERVAILRHPGANLGPWNVGSHRLTQDQDRVRVDGEYLVFFHFSGVLRTVDGRWQTFYTHEAMRQAAVLEHIYRPYLVALEAVSRRLAERFGIAGVGSVRSLDANTPVLSLVAAGDRLSAAA